MPSRLAPLICAAAGLVMAWAARNRMNSDGMAYLDIALEALRSGPAALINSYWSPGYPAMVALVFGAVQPAPEMRFAWVHALNFLMYLACLWGFQRFLAALDPEPGAWRVLAYVVFAWTHIHYVTLVECTPDMAVAAVALWAASQVLRLDDRWTGFAWLGGTLAAGYWIKAVLFPASVLLLATLALTRPSKRWAVSVATYLTLSAPLVWMQSRAANKWTIGRSGSLNYSWYVNGQQTHSGWLAADEHGVPANPPRIVHRAPLTFEYVTDRPGTYPLWYDPAYWYAGTQVRFVPARLIREIVSNARFYLKLFLLDAAALVGAVAVLCWLARRASRCGWPPRADLWMMLWPLSVLALYACVHVEHRFLGAFLTIFWCGLFYSVRSRVDASISRPILLVAALGVLIPFSMRSLDGVALGISGFRDDHVIAASVRDLGLRPGDRVATVGRPFQSFWAHIAELKVAAEIPEPSDFWGAPDQHAEVLERLRALGIRALVARSKPAYVRDPRWRPVAGTEEPAHVIVLGQP